MLELTFPTESGLEQLKITLRPDLAQRTVAALVHAIDDGSEAAGWPPLDARCVGCATMYRSEAELTEPPSSCGEVGPCGSYSLIQGRINGLGDTPTEGTPLVKRGMVARIQVPCPLSLHTLPPLPHRPTPPRPPRRARPSLREGPTFFWPWRTVSEWGHAFTV